MEGVRKLLKNTQEIAYAHQYNTQIRAEFANQAYHPPLVPIPESEWETEKFFFKACHVNNYYKEETSYNNKGVVSANNERGDIIANITYEGIVRFQYDPILEQELNLAVRL